MDDTRLIDYTNRAVRELMNEGDWPGVVDTWYLRYDSASGMLTLPGHLDRLLNVSIDDTPKEIRSPWFEFVQYGPGSVRDEEKDSQNGSGAELDGVAGGSRHGPSSPPNRRAVVLASPYHRG